MSTKVKICGVTRKEDAELALALGADYIGINVYEKSPRAVALDQVPALLAIIPQGKRVVVDVAPSPQRLEELLQLGFDFHQLHFDLDISMATVAAWSGLVGPQSLWVAPRIPPQEPSFPQILMEFSETILLDTYSSKAYGGTGQSGQNWQRFLDCTLLYQHKNWILAGGLSPDNIREALEFTEAETVDLASGVESEPGIKDPEKLKRLFEAVRG